MRPRQFPVTIGAVVLLWTLALTTGSTHHRPPAGVGAGLDPIGAGHWWVLLTSTWWARGLVTYLFVTVVMLVCLAVAERHLGSARTAASLVAVSVLGTAGGLAMAAVLQFAGGRWAAHLRHSVVVDPVAAGVGVLLVASAVMPVLWRRRVRVTSLVLLAMFVLYVGHLPDFVRLSAALVGLGLGQVLFGHRSPAEPPPSHKETRALLALVVAATALGPLLAAITGSDMGPLGLLRYLVADPPPDTLTVHDICADPAAAAECAELHIRLRLTGVGPALMAVMPVVLLLVAAEGLRRGRRAAWWAALVLNLGLAALGLVLAVSTVRTPADQRVVLGPGTHPHSWLLIALPTLVPLVIAGVIFTSRGEFGVRAPHGTYRRWVALVGVAFLLTSSGYVVGSLATPAGYDRPVGLAVLLLDLPTRFLPPGYLGEIEPSFLPDHTTTVVLYEWTGVVFWVVTAVAGLLAFTLTRQPPRTAAGTQVRALLTGPGGANLAHMITWRGHSYWFTKDHRAVIGYRVVSGVAITTGGPVGDPSRRAEALRGFAEHCHASGWTMCLYSVGEELLPTIHELGWRHIQVAEEMVLPLADLRFTGKAWQDVRSALNRARKLGVRAEWCRFRSAPPAVVPQIRAISDEWVARRGLPELGFTLGGLNELVDDEVRLLIAVDDAGHVHAVTSWLPVYRDGAVVGWTLDFMRRRTDAMIGSTEFLIASAAQLCRAEGAQFLSLSGAPLARVDRGQPVKALQCILDLAGRVVEPVYGFRSLLEFKAKFQPCYEPLYLAYADPAALPSIATAIGRAYLPRLSPAQLGRLGLTLIGPQ